jgi:hypothetical protein
VLLLLSMGGHQHEHLVILEWQIADRLAPLLAPPDHARRPAARRTRDGFR